MNEEPKNNEHIKDILSREFKGDYSTMSNGEFVDKLKNALYQLFLIEVDDIAVSTRYNMDGSYINISIQGELFRDIDAENKTLDEYLDGYNILEELDEDEF